MARPALLLLLLPLSVFAQSTIQGVVLDPSGAAVPDATITATLDDTGAVRTGHTGTDGRYRIPALPIGTYTVRCEKPGFQRAAIPSVYLALNQTLEQPIQLKLATAGSSVDVREQADALDTTAPTSGTGISGEVLEETPSQNRSYLGVVLLAPGVAPAAGSNALRSKAGMRSATPDSGFTFAGMRARNNSLSIDGLDNRDETTGSSRVAVGQEAVAEFRVTASNVAPEFGGAAGGNLNVVTLSGTNRFHGDVNLWASDSFIEARDPEAETSVRPSRREYQPEAALNGPLRRDRTFFAGTIEDERESSQEYSEVPEAAQTSLINAALAGPRFSRAAVSSIAAGLFNSESTSTQTSLKLTHYLGTANQLTARYAYSRAAVDREVLGADNFSEQSARGSSHNQDQSFAAGWQTVRGPSFVNELRFQFARRSVELDPNSRGALLEIPGVVDIGQSPVLDASRTEDHFELAESATVVRGAHQFGFGGSVQRITLDSRMADRFAGIFIFPTLNDFLAGTPDVFLQAFGDPRTRYSTFPAAVWAQDQWRPLSGVTITGGLRYEAQRLPAPFGSSTRNLAPRLGIAWQPRGRGPWVFRAGAGLFYDRYPLAYLNNGIQKDGVHGFEQYAVGADAAFAFALAHGGTLAAPLPGIAHSVYTPDPSFDATPTYARKFTAGVERSLGPDTTLTVEYMNVAGFHLPRLRNAALTLPPQFTLEQSAGSTYQGVTVTLRHRLSKEVTYLLAYTAGSARDDAGDFTEQPFNPASTRLDWARSQQYQAHRVVASGLFELPFDDIGAPQWLQAVGRNLDMAPVISAGSPRPVNALATTDLYRTGAYPITARPDGLARNPFYERGLFNIDLRLTKGFVWWKDHGIFLFGIGFYNLTNHTNPLRVSPYYGLDSYRGLIETLNARQAQFSFQWEF
ncbi:MAG: TonB-dependent receptor [Acidobacteria bacterium]|nr:TonB-dependent receptor [Acidobacteriota bacterium]